MHCGTLQFRRSRIQIRRTESVGAGKGLMGEQVATVTACYTLLRECCHTLLSRARSNALLCDLAAAIHCGRAPRETRAILNRIFVTRYTATPQKVSMIQ